MGKNQWWSRDRNTWERISDESGIEIHGKESVQASVCYREHNNQCPYQFTPLPFTLRLQTPLPLPCQLTQSSAPLPFSLHLQPSFLFFGFHHSPLCNTPDATLKHAVFSVFFTAPLDNAIWRRSWPHKCTTFAARIRSLRSVGKRFVVYGPCMLSCKHAGLL